MAANLKLTLTGPELQGVMLRFENEGASPAAVIRSYRPDFYSSHDLKVVDAAGKTLGENQIVHSCGTPYALTADMLLVLPPGGSGEVGVDTLGYRLPPGTYRIQLTYRTNRSWLQDVDPEPPGFEHLAEGVWTSNEIEVLVK